MVLCMAVNITVGAPLSIPNGDKGPVFTVCNVSVTDVATPDVAGVMFRFAVADLVFG